MSGRGLYVHIPFCLKKCHYCNFVITTKRGPEIQERFLELLEREALQALDRYGPLKFETLYLGGGTPSALEAGETERLVRFLRRHFEFADEAEVTCEVNPGDVDESKLRTYRDLGINRISLGVQSFRETLLDDMGRPHEVREILETLRLLKQLGFRNVSMDLICRLPGQTLEDFEDSVEKTIALGAAQVSLYDLDVHAATVYGRRQAEGRMSLPDEKEHLAMAECAHRLFTGAGYERYELSAFAKPGFEARHNLLYWHNQEYLGLGPGAFSYMDRVRYQFAEDVNRWLEKTAKGDWACDTEDRLDDEKVELESILTGLRLCEGLDLRRFPILSPRLEPRMREFERDGLLETVEGRFRFTKKGAFLAESLFAAVVGFAADGG